MRVGIVEAAIEAAMQIRRAPGALLAAKDSPLEREVYNKMMPSQWIAEYPRVTIDEVQKSPQIFDTIKANTEGTVTEVFVKVGDQVENGADLMKVE